MTSVRSIDSKRCYKKCFLYKAVLVVKDIKVMNQDIQTA